MNNSREGWSFGRFFIPTTGDQINNKIVKHDRTLNFKITIKRLMQILCVAMPTP